MYLHFNFVIHFKKGNLFYPSIFLSPLFKVYKKVVKFSFTQQKMFWVLVFSICIRYFAYPTDPTDHLLHENLLNSQVMMKLQYLLKYMRLQLKSLPMVSCFQTTLTERNHQSTQPMDKLMKRTFNAQVSEKVLKTIYDRKLHTKGQIISDFLLDVIIWTKLSMKNLTNFCPRIQKAVKSTK